MCFSHYLHAKAKILLKQATTASFHIYPTSLIIDYVVVYEVGCDETESTWPSGH
jgi:hypothetical protein